MKKPNTALYLLLSLILFNQSLGQTPAQSAPASQTNSQSLQLAGLHAPVTVRRDERGIPYIEAANDADLYFAQGYVTASDRLFQMELFRRTAGGELAEIFGAGPDGSALESDKQHRRYGFTQLAEAQVEHLPAKLRAALEDYGRGVNAYTASLDAKSLPPEFQILQFKPRPWRVADSLLVGKLFDEALSTSWQSDLMRAGLADLPKELRDQLFPETSPLDVILVGSDHLKSNKQSRTFSTKPSESAAIDRSGLEALSRNEQMTRAALERVGLYAEDSAASNNWVISGKHTFTGKPLLANDPHLAPSAPSIWYMTHLSTPDHHAAGVAVAGLPGIAIGHNDYIAWGATSLEPDVQDIYLEKFDTTNSQRYQTPQGWREVSVRHEEIKVRKIPVSPQTETVPFDVVSTRHGPIIFEKDSKRYALRWTALDPEANLVESFYLLNSARNWNDFRAALRNYSGPAFNMIYADVQGHIGYYGAGRFPIRKTGSGKLPYDGATDEGEWTGFIPFDALPHLYDPPSGIIVTANNRIVGLDYPYALTVNYEPAYRAHRINELLHAKEKFSLDDFRAIQGDTYTISGVLFARAFLQDMRDENRTVEMDEMLTDAVHLLSNWDGRVLIDSRAVLLVAHMRNYFRDLVLKARLGTERAKLYRYSNSDTLIDRIVLERPHEWLPKEYRSYAELFRACLLEARAELTKDFGANEANWTWGREAMAHFPHPLASLPLIGQRFLIQPFPFNGSTTSLPTVNRGTSVSMRFIADPGDWDRTQLGITLGESGVPSSPHWKDQLDDWRAVKPRTFPFSRAAVASAAKETQRLEPVSK